MRIAWHLERSHGIRASGNGVHRVLRRNGLARLSVKRRKRSLASLCRREEIRRPPKRGRRACSCSSASRWGHVARKQLTAIDDAAGIQVPRIDERRNQHGTIGRLHRPRSVPLRLHPAWCPLSARLWLL
jgi:hypothetical protein